MIVRPEMSAVTPLLNVEDLITLRCRSCSSCSHPGRQC